MLPSEHVLAKLTMLELSMVTIPVSVVVLELAVVTIPVSMVVVVLELAMMAIPVSVVRSMPVRQMVGPISDSCSCSTSCCKCPHASHAMVRS